MRAGLLTLVLAVAACGGGSVDGGGGEEAGADAGPTRCEVNADCDDGDSCTTDVCDVTSGACGVSEIDPCAEATMMIEDDFESVAGALVEEATVFAPEQGGWTAEPGPGCPVQMDFVLEDDFDGYGKESAFTHGAGGWKMTAVGGGAVRLKADPDQEGNFAAECMGTTTTGSYAQASHDMSPQASGRVDLRFRPPGKTKAKTIALDEDGATRFYMYFDNDGLMKVSNGGTKVTVGPYPEDVWMNLRMEWDAGSDRVDLTVDGELYADRPLAAPITSHIDRLRVRTATGTGLSFMIDDVSASGGDEVEGGAGASLRVGDGGGGCAGPASALRAFASAEAGTLEVDVRVEEAATIDLVGGAQTRMSLLLEPDGSVRWSQGGIDVPVAGAKWTPGKWMGVMLRWDARKGAADLWVDDMDSAAAVALPFMESSGAIDGMRAAVGAGGVVWLDNLRVSASP